ncbi:MAG: hypothetical protein J0L52_04975 [Caulobacterales bacterium]|nr:hypothetical protein [Caulobacterales bacterium]
MKRWFLGFATLFSLPSIVACATGFERPQAELLRTPEGSGAPARDGQWAVNEEFEAAERAGTAEAYRLFAERHPDHPLARVARERIDRMQQAPR